MACQNGLELEGDGSGPTSTHALGARAAGLVRRSHAAGTPMSVASLGSPRRPRALADPSLVPSAFYAASLQAWVIVGDVGEGNGSAQCAPGPQSHTLTLPRSRPIQA